MCLQISIVSSAIARGGARGEACPPIFFTPKVKPDMYKMLKTTTKS